MAEPHRLKERDLYPGVEYVPLVFRRAECIMKHHTEPAFARMCEAARRIAGLLPAGYEPPPKFDVRGIYVGAMLDRARTLEQQRDFWQQMRPTEELSAEIWRSNALLRDLIWEWMYRGSMDGVERAYEYLSGTLAPKVHAFLDAIHIASETDRRLRAWYLFLLADAQQRFLMLGDFTVVGRPS